MLSAFSSATRLELGRFWAGRPRLICARAWPILLTHLRYSNPVGSQVSERSLSTGAAERRRAQQSPLLISVVVPCYNEEDSLHLLYHAVVDALATRDDIRRELIFVDDGSKDRTADILRELTVHDPQMTVVTLSRNFGHQAAICAGLHHARGDAVIVCDADLQDTPDAMLKMIDRWQQGADVVYGVRNQRKASAMMRA